jgi:adenylate cyclase
MASRYRDGMSARDYLAQVAAIEITDISDLLPRIQTPTLIVRDRSSPFSAPELTRRVAAAIPGAQAVTVDSPAAMGAAILSFLKGEEPSARPVSAASSVVTVLFTDVVGHTEMMRRLGDAKGREVLREHERITREVLAQHAGTEVKTMGDGFMASFGSVTKAVECAISLQKAFTDRNHVGGLDRGVGVEQLQHDAPNSDEGVAVAQPLRASEPAPTSVEPLNVRVGLNAGEPIEDAGDLFGSSVILASRIAAKANGGEIFASMAVRELCTGKGFLFADLGDHELRGFEDPVRVFEVKWRDHA